LPIDLPDTAQLLARMVRSSMIISPGAREAKPSVNPPIERVAAAGTLSPSCCMRRVALLTVYIAMVLLGTTLSIEFLVHGGRIIVFTVGGFLAVFGCYLLWIEFLSPNRERL
jgi:hypothetical protein